MIAAPFYGEFGWEVALWAPFLRHRAQTDKITVLCKPGHGFLYDDFAFEILEAPPPPGITKVDCQKAWLDGALFKEATMLDFVKEVTQRKIVYKDLIEPSAMPVNCADGPPALSHNFHKPKLLTECDKEPGWIAIHPRTVLGRSPERNWKIGKWDQVMEALTDDVEHVLLVGSKEDSFNFNNNHEDLRGKPLHETVPAIARCQLIVGPSSGPMPLANYTGTTCVWWSPADKDITRYESRCWNPFSVRNYKAASSWSPSVTEVLGAVRQALEETR